MLVTFQPDELKAIIFDAIAEGLKTLTPINSPPPNDRIYNLEEAAERLNLSKYTVAKYARLGLLKRAMPHIKGFRFRYDELMRFSNEYRNH
jgi:hypothetical protein